MYVARLAALLPVEVIDCSDEWDGLGGHEIVAQLNRAL